MNNNDEYKRKIVLQAISDVTSTDNPELFARYNSTLYDVAMHTVDMVLTQPRKGYDDGIIDGYRRGMRDALEEMRQCCTKLQERVDYRSPGAPDPQKQYDVNPNMVLDLPDHSIEFKNRNEYKDDFSEYWTWEEAMDQFYDVDEEGWRLPTKGELSALTDMPWVFNKIGLVFFSGTKLQDLILKANGHRCFRAGQNIGVEEDAQYWTSTRNHEGEAWNLSITNDRSCMECSPTNTGFPVRLVRTIK